MTASGEIYNYLSSINARFISINCIILKNLLSSFIDTTFKVKHLMIGHVLEGGLLIYIYFFPATLMDPMAFCCLCSYY